MPRLAIPTSPDELEATLSDNTKLTNIMSEGQLPEFIKAYAASQTKADPDQVGQVRDQVRSAWAEIVAENPDLIGRFNQVAHEVKDHGKLHNPEAAGAQLDGKFSNLGDFIRHTAPDKFINASMHDKRRQTQNAMSSTVPADGGFLVPEEMRAELLRVALETAVVRPRARVLPMNSLRLSVPMLDVTSNVSSVGGGVIAYWTEEGAALTASQPAFGRVALEAKKLTAYTEVPNELLADSVPALAAIISSIFPEAISWFEDAAFLAGTGVGEPLGILNSTNGALLSVTKESGQAASTIVWQNIIKMYARMLPQSLNKAVWVVSPDTFPELATMALAVGTGGAPIWLTNGAEGAPTTLLGRPVIISEKVSKLGTAGDIAFLDFGHYLIGDRQAMSAVSSEHYKFGNDSVAYRVIERVDGRPWLQSPITPKNTGPTLSPYVTLATRS